MTLRFETRVFLLSLLGAASLHFLGSVMVRLETIALPKWQVTEVALMEDIPVLKNPPPLISTQKYPNAPSFLSLPLREGSSEGKAFFPFHSIRYDPLSEEESLFKEAKKMFSEEAHYLENELEVLSHLPLEESQKIYHPWMIQDPPSKTSPLPSFQLIYKGINPLAIGAKLNFLKKFLEAIPSNKHPKEDLLLSLSFNENKELLRCHIDRSSGLPSFDQELLRLLQSTVPPLTKSSKTFRGQLLIVKTRKKND